MQYGYQYCSNGAIYAYSSQTCQYQVQQQCPHGCNTATGGTTSGYATQCAPNPQQQGGIPTASLTGCPTKSMDVGAKINLGFNCQNAVTSNGVGFSTNGQLSGSAQITVEAPQCVVQVNKVSMIFITNPSTITLQSSDAGDSDDDDERSTLGWTTSGMESCVVSSPDFPDFTEKNKNKKNTTGTVKTPVFTSNIEEADFVLTCMTLGGEERTKSETISIES
jgi:hypothetical protein